MVVNPADVPITREDVQNWVKKWKRMSKTKRPTIEDYIRQQVDKLELSDEMVLKAHKGEDPKLTHAADLIIDDLGSYGVGAGS